MQQSKNMGITIKYRNIGLMRDLKAEADVLILDAASINISTP